MKKKTKNEIEEELWRLEYEYEKAEDSNSCYGASNSMIEILARIDTIYWLLGKDKSKDRSLIKSKYVLGY